MDNEAKAQAIIESAFPNLWIIKQLMDEVSMVDVDLLRALYLIQNIQKVSGYGTVTLNIKNKEIISVSGENKFISQSELMKNLKTLQQKEL